MRRRPDTLSASDVLKLLKAGGQAHRVWLLLGSDAGLRNAEIRSITPDHVLPTGLLYVRGKGGIERTVPLTSRLAEAIRLEDLTYLGRAWHEDLPYIRVTGRALQYRFRIIARRAGVYLPGRCVHTLRHSYATRSLAAGVTLVELRDLLGHVNIRTTSRYLHASAEALQAAARKLERHDREAVFAKQPKCEGLEGQVYLFRGEDGGG